MSRISGESTSRSIDRRQWSDLDSVDHELLLFGHGEGYVEEVYFGKGFSQAPTFTFSAFFQQDEVDVMPRYLIAPRGSLTREVDEYGLGNDSQSHGGLIQDPGFESQAKYHVISNDYAVASATIPTVNRMTNDRINAASISDRYFPVQQLLADTTLNNTWSHKFVSPNGFEDPYGPHRWVQTDDTRDMWTVDLTESHDLGVGEAGQASATAIIGSNGYTNWLIPFQTQLANGVDSTEFANGIGVGFFHSELIATPEYQWRGIVSTEEFSNVREFESDGIFATAYPSPYLGGFVGMMYVKSESDVEVQVNATFANWDDTGRRHDNNFGKKIMDDVQWKFPGAGGGKDPVEGEYSYRELASIDFNHVHTGSGWGRVDVSLPYDGIRAYPDGFHCLARHRQPTITWWTLRFRVKGVPGTRVYLDNIYMDVEQRNSEIPILTIGVDEWIRDEAGVYIGAKLWIKSGTPSGNTCKLSDLSGEDWLTASQS